MRLEDDRWFVRSGTRTDGVTLICAAYAGGNPERFRAWARQLDADIDVLALRLPGHGIRLTEKPYQRWGPLIDDAFDALSPLLARPHAFFGHSFGARLAYELAHRACAAFPGRTRRLFVSGCRTPDRAERPPILYRLPEEEFRAALLSMGGTPVEVLSDPELSRLLLPTIRAEIRLAELWDDRHGTGVDAPITAMFGRDDEVATWRSMYGWPGFGGRDSELVEMPGGHFFVESHLSEVIALVNTRLRTRLCE